MPASSLPPILPPAKPFTSSASARTPPAASSCSTATATPALRSTRRAWPTATWLSTATSLPPFSPVRPGNLVNNNHPSPMFFESVHSKEGYYHRHKRKLGYYALPPHWRPRYLAGATSLVKTGELRSENSKG